MTKAIKKTGSDSAVGIYVHIPFCVRKCLYCDFLSGPASGSRMADYLDALIREIDVCGEEGTKADTIFIGGGTPSLLEISLMDRIFEELHRKFRVSPEAEITMEANPGTLSLEKLKAYRGMGINRLSIGLQSADDGELKMLGRIHSFEDFRRTWEMARDAGFENMNLDLISGLPLQTEESWEKTLRTAALFRPEHISAYSLIVEDGTPFAEMDLSLPDEDTEYRMYDDTKEILAEYGFHRYEISNYALPGCESRHNSSYWTGKDYLGFGIGAASLRNGRRYTVTRDMERYLDPARKKEELLTDLCILTLEDRMEEFMFLGLRMTCGTDKEEFRRRFACEMDDIYGEVIRRHKALGLLDEEGTRVFLTDRGIHVSNRVMADFLL